MRCASERRAPVCVALAMTVFLLSTFANGCGSRSEEKAIMVVVATYGGNVGVPAGNATADVASSCNGKTSCQYAVQTPKLGDPKVGEPKDFVVTYRCGDAEAKRTTVAAEAGNGGVADLRCP